jgi:hypothetical protein
MKCPVCEITDLVMTERQGVEIDYCPKCRGVWLDRGELDKIVERMSVEERRSAPPAQNPYPEEKRKRYEDAPPSYAPQQRYDDDYYDDDRYKHQQHPHKKKSWLGEVFDIFD